MYTAYFGLREKPFNITSDLRFFYRTDAHQEAYAGLLAGIRERKGFLLLTGEVGTGKTTLLRRVMRDLEEPVRCLFFSFSNAALTFEELLSFICSELELSGERGGRLQKIRALNAFLLACMRQEGTVVLLVDEAQNLGDDVLQNLHLLSTLDTATETFPLQIVLVGQPELELKLAQPELRQLKQRVALWYQLDCLKEWEVGPFIYHRLQIAGCECWDLFSPEAVERIAVYSKGIPRLINVICDNALLIAYSTAHKTVSVGIIEEVAQDLQFGAGSGVTTGGATKQKVREAREATGDTQWVQGSWDAARNLDAEAVVQVGVEPVSTETSWTSPGAVLLSGSVLFILLVIGLFYYREPASVLRPSTPKPPVITRADPAIESEQEFGVAEGQSSTSRTEIESSSDKTGVKVEKKGEVAVARAPSQQPPVITQATPTVQELSVNEGQSLTFAIETESSQARSLRYAWLLDGQEQAEGETWTYQPNFNEGGAKLKEVKVRVSGWENHTAEKTWRVRVRDVNRPPQIAAAVPQADFLEVAAGETQQFSIQASDPDTDDRLTYLWLLDGQEVAHGRSWQFRIPSPPSSKTQHRVEVEVSDRGDLKDRLTWNIAVKQLSPPPRIVAAHLRVKEVVPSPPLPRISEDEVRGWLEVHRQAWEKKNVDLLVELGVLPSHSADRARKILSEYENFQVTLQNVNIRIAGSQAEVTFSRVDTVEGTVLSHPDRKVFILEKAADGRLAARPQ